MESIIAGRDDPVHRWCVLSSPVKRPERHRDGRSKTFPLEGKVPAGRKRCSTVVYYIWWFIW